MHSDAAAFAFLVALFLPVWLPLFFLPAKSWLARLRPLLAIGPASWYLFLLGFCPYPYRAPPWLLVAGFCLAFLMLALSANARRQMINVPLWLSLAAATHSVWCNV
jgi:hypothetical protein